MASWSTFNVKSIEILWTRTRIFQASQKEIVNPEMKITIYLLLKKWTVNILLNNTIY